MNNRQNYNNIMNMNNNRKIMPEEEKLTTSNKL